MARTLNVPRAPVNLQLDRRRNAVAADAHPLRLLAVDDDPDYLAYFSRVTRRLGFTIDTASDAGAAMKMASGMAYDVAAIDQAMPGDTGMDLIARLRLDPATRGLYTMMLTGQDDVETKVAALNAGFDDFVAKSSPETELMAKLAAARRVAARQRTLDVTIRELYGLATRDELTGLFNRRFFTEEVDRLLAFGVQIGVIVFDLDGFKQINDTHGHLAGDRVLRDIGALFHRSTRSEDVIARIGGDEFVMAIPRIELKDVERIARRLERDAQALRWEAGGVPFTLSMSTGIASSGLLVRPTLAQLFEAADRDMYKNKWLRKHPDDVMAIPTPAPRDEAARA
jgi:two-component system, cell cycle response regulator